MYQSFKIVKVNSKYCDYLRKYDNKVSYNAGLKDLRPFIGVLFKVNNMEYFAPLSSPKPKHKTIKNTLDLMKIDNGNYGVVNFNNMIPVNSKNYRKFDLNKNYKDKAKKFRIELLRNQLRWLTVHKKEVYRKSKLLYNLYKNDKLPKNVKDRCCNFILLEEKCQNYKDVYLCNLKLEMSK